MIVPEQAVAQLTKSFPPADRQKIEGVRPSPEFALGLKTALRVNRTLQRLSETRSAMVHRHGLSASGPIYTPDNPRLAYQSLHSWIVKFQDWKSEMSEAGRRSQEDGQTITRDGAESLHTKTQFHELFQPIFVGAQDEPICLPDVLAGLGALGERPTPEQIRNFYNSPYWQQMKNRVQITDRRTPSKTYLIELDDKTVTVTTQWTPDMKYTETYVQISSFANNLDYQEAELKPNSCYKMVVAQLGL